jgi:hypothetical protein
MIGRKMIAGCCMAAAVALLTLAVEGSAAAYNCVRVPEIDPQTLGAGLAVLGGAAAMLLEC